jgi:hypothetical protein
VAVFELAETGFGVGLGAVGGDHLGRGPVAAVGEQDPLAKDLVLQRAAGGGAGAEGDRQAGRGLAGEGDGENPVQPAGAQDFGDLGLDAVAVFAGVPAGEAGLQLGQLAAGLGQGLLEPAGLAGVEGGRVGDDYPSGCPQRVRGSGAGRPPGCPRNAARAR